MKFSVPKGVLVENFYPVTKITDFSDDVGENIIIAKGATHFTPNVNY